MRRNLIGFLFVSAMVGAIASFASAQTFSFPAGSTYKIKAGNSTISAEYKYAPPIPQITIPINNPLDTPGWEGYAMITELSNLHKGIYVYPSRLYPGPTGKYDISDPWNPKGPYMIHETNGSKGGLGPLSNGFWDHEPRHRGWYSAAENSDGETRMFHGIGVTGGNLCETVTGPCRVHTTGVHFLSWDSLGGGMVAQQIDETYFSMFDGWAQAVDATEDGKFFLFKGRTANSSFGIAGVSQTILKFDLSEPTGTINEPFLESSGSIAWSGVSELKVIKVPGQRNHFLLGLGGTSGGTSIRVAEISSSDGRVVRQKTSTAPSVANPPAGKRTSLSSLTAPSVVTVGSKVYVIGRDAVYYEDPFVTGYEDTVVGVYEFNAQDLTLTRKGGIQVPSANGRVSVASDVNGGSTPILVLNTEVYSGTGFGNVFRAGEELRFYSLKDRLSGNHSPQPDFVVQGEMPNFPVNAGNVVMSLSPYQVLLKKDGTQTNLYLYRNAFVYTGRTRTIQDAPFESAESGPITTDPGYQWASYRGVGSLRVDKIDVTGIVTGVIPPGGGVPPPGGTPPGGGGIGTGGQCAATYPNNASLRLLCEQIEALKAQACKISPSLSFCAKP